MNQRMKKILPVFKRIQRLGDNAKRDYIKKCNRDFLECISECCKNVLRGNVPLTPKQTAKLRNNKQNRRALSIKKTSLRKKRTILQNGGLLGAILAPALSILGSLIVGNATR